MKRRWSFVLAWIAFVVICTAIILPVRISTDMGTFLPAGATPEQELIVDQLHRGASNRLLMVVVGSRERPVTPSELQQLRDSLDETGLFRMVVHRPDPELLAARDTLFRYRYLLSDRLTADYFREDALHEVFSDIVERLRRADAPVDEAVIARDPTGEFRHLLRSWLGGQGTDGDGSGRWLEPGRAVILATANAAPYALAEQERALEAIRDQASQFESAIPVEISGAPAIAVATRDLIRKEVLRVSMLAALATVLVLTFALRSLPAVVLALLPVLSGLLAGAAAVRLGFGELHGISLAFGATLLGVTVDYPLHYLWRARTEDGAGSARTIRRPLLIGAISTACGFGALAIAGFSGLQQLAVLSVTGILVATVVTSWLLPVLVPRPVPVYSGPLRIKLHCPRWLPWTMAGILMLGAGIAAVTTLRMTTDLGMLSPVPSELAERDGELRRELGFPETRFVVRVTAADREAALQKTERVVERLEHLAAKGHVERHAPVTRLLPSARTQQARAQALPPSGQLRASVNGAMRGLPLRAEAFEPFIEDVEASRTLEPLQPDMLPDGLVRDRIRARLLHRGEHRDSLVYLGGVVDASAIETELKEESGARLIDLQQETGRLMTQYQRRALMHFALGVGAIAIILLIGTASAGRTLTILAVAGGGVGGTVLFLAGLGASLSVFHVIALLLVVGLSIDYGVFARPGDRIGMESVALCAISSALAFAILATADIPLLRAIGITVMCGTILCFVLAMLFSMSGRPETENPWT